MVDEEVMLLVERVTEAQRYAKIVSVVKLCERYLYQCPRKQLWTIAVAFFYLQN